MRRLHLLVALVALVALALSLSIVGTAAAKPGRPGNDTKPPKARITWSVPSVERRVAPGETVRVSVTLTSSADLANVTFVAPGGLGKVLKVEPAVLSSLAAGVPANVTLTISVPSEGAHCQAGVVKVHAGKKNLPAPLKVKVILPGEAGCGA
jgi:hypothetical protein